MFEAGKTYIESDPYRAPEITTVLKVEWVGPHPSHPESIFCFGFKNSALADEEWRMDVRILKDAEKEYYQMDEWVEAVWGESQKAPYWRQKTPEEQKQ